MGCKYWECKYNEILQKGEIGDCGKPNGSNIRHSCPNNPNLNGDFCTDGEARDIEKNAEHHYKIQ